MFIFFHLAIDCEETIIITEEILHKKMALFIIGKIGNIQQGGL